MCKHCAFVPILRLVALVLLAIAVAACLVGFVSPFWAYYNPGLPCTSPAGNASTTATEAPTAVVPTTTASPPRPAEIEGLWGRCNANNYTLCTWFWDNNFELERCFPTWHKAVQGLYLGGFVLLLITVLIACAHICCGCCINSTSLPTFFGFLTIFGFLGVLASVVVYGIMSYVDRDIFFCKSVADAVNVTTATTITTAAPATTGVALFEWGIYVAAGGALVSLLAAAIFFCDGKRSAAAGGAGRYETAATIEI